MYFSLVISILILIVSTESKQIATRNLHPDVGLNIIQLAEKYGYPLESHNVQTSDGYILTLHRIPYGPNNSSRDDVRPPVLLMHGLLSSSVDWINMGPGVGLGLLLADNGYDVWMGNQRGNTWSRQHITLDPDLDAEKFFNFSFHEIGVYDLPAKIDYILETTEQEKVFYVGHSQGTTDFFVMGSERPEYNDKIALMIALAPIAYMGELPNPIIRQLVESYDLIKQLIDHMKIYEFLPHFDFYTDIGEQICSDSSEFQDTCLLFLNIICGFDFDIDPNFIPVITSNAPAGSSINQILHYAQEIRSGNFAQYDHDREENVVKYGQETPPLYDVTKITAPVSLYYANNDWLAAIDDVLKLGDGLSNLVNLKKVSNSQFNHLDFLWAQHVADLVYNDVIAEIKATN